MLFAAIWMDLEIFLLSEVSRVEKSHDITYTWSLKKGTNYLNKLDNFAEKMNKNKNNGQIKVIQDTMKKIFEEKINVKLTEINNKT